MKAEYRALLGRSDGATIVEFALVLPVMLMLCMGLADLAFQAYAQSLLNGEVQKAGRDGTIEDNLNNTAGLDKAVEDQMKKIVPNATFVSSRSNYDNYAAMAGEPFTDVKYPNDATGTLDGICDHGESYTDVNGNGKYDKDLSQSGEGGANDVSEYTMTVTYQRLFPIASLIGWDPSVTLSSTTLLKNQPYAKQSANTGTGSGTCS
jgi:Flp pilus assembly protein TadG